MPQPEPDDDGDAIAAFPARRRPPALEAGGAGTFEIEVTPDLTAEHLGSGDLPVLASPAIVRLVEQAAVAMLRDRLPPELTTVGASFELIHRAPTGLGARARVAVTLEPGEARTLRFAFAASDDAGEIATGSHARVIVEREPFLASAHARVRSGKK